MANPVLQFLITAKDEATSTLGKIGGALSQLGGVVTGVAKSAIHLVFPDFGDSVRAAEALEIQMGKLRAGIEATGGTAGLTAEEIDEMARRLDEATLGSAEGFRNAAVELLTFKSVGKDAFERTLKAAQDLADAGFGTVESATVQLGKALEDPVKGLTSLTRVGVSFTDQQRAMIEGFIRLGDAASAQNVILAAVEGQVQGVASAAGGGLAGAVDLVGKRLTDLKETVGAVLTPVLTKLNLVWADVIGAVQKAGAEIAGPLASNTEQAGQALKGFGDSIGQFLSQTIRDLGQWIASLDWRAIQTGARQVGENLSELAKGFTAFGSVAGQVIKGVTVGVNAVQVAFHAVVGGVQGLVGRFLSGLAAVEEQAAQVGLGSLEHANELRAEAERWKRDAAESIEAVGKNAAEGVEAFKRLTGATDDAARAQQGVKDNLPTAELQTLTKTLDDYRAIAERANHAAEQARKDFEAGKISAAEYGQKLTAAAEANHQLAVETHKQTESLQKNTEAAEASAKAKEILRTQETTLLDLAAKFRTAQQDAAEAAVEEAHAALELAQAKSDERAAREAALLVAQRAVEAAQATQVAQQAELQILESQRRQLIETAGGLDRLTAAQRLELGQIEQTIQAKQRDIATSDTKIQTQQREVEQAQKAIGPVGNLIQLYEERTKTLGRETAAVERAYGSKVRDLEVEKAQAEAKGDTTKVAELAVEIKQVEAEQAQAVADAKKRELQAQIDLIEAQKLALSFDEKITKEGREKLAVMEEQIATLKDLQDAEQDKADSARAAADAEKNLAEEAKQSGDAQEDAHNRASESARRAYTNVSTLVEGYEGLTEAGKAFAEAANITGEFRGLFAFGEAVQAATDHVLEALDAEKALNAEVERLVEVAQGVGPVADEAHNRLLFMAREGALEIKGLTEAGEQARQTLEDIKYAALEAEQALAEMAADFNKQILQLQGDQQGLLDLEQAERLQQLEDLYAQAGKLGDAEYRRAKAQAEALYQLKRQQLQDESDATVEKTVNSANAVGAALRSVSDAAEVLNGKTLSNLISQTNQLHRSLAAIDEIL
ncbi:MAG: phage tail length tape measure family protein [Gammaproteobacteria bacterium]|nr:phage tail length tape measure family protein [Gammaproteobacteria bacterium]